MSCTTAAFLNYTPVPLRFGTSGLRGLVHQMTDLEVFINTRGFVEYLQQAGEAPPGGHIAIAEDLRDVDPKSGLSSSPRIARAVTQAVRSAGMTALRCGQVPTPALAYHAAYSKHGPIPCIMVTGSHIPADRNGVKFYKPSGEVLKSDEAGILAAVSAVRAREYDKNAEQTPFDERGMFKATPVDTAIDDTAREAYRQRYLELFPRQRPLEGKRIVVYEHSAVGRDLLEEILAALGAEVIGVGRSETFISVDTEDVSEADLQMFRQLVQEYRPAAIVSTDGDSDRPLVLDERGRFHRGDVLGLVTAEFVGAQFAAVPISTTDAVDRRIEQLRDEAPAAALELTKTRIGSPHVIAAMQRAVAEGRARVVAWEANGGFLHATDLEINGQRLKALPTRDALLPILAVLLSATRRDIPLSQLFAELPQRATGAGLIDDFPAEASAAIFARFRPANHTVVDVRFAGDSVLARDAAGEPLEQQESLQVQLSSCRSALQRYFPPQRQFGAITRLNLLDGIRIWFDSGEIVHLRPSGNAPQLRVYAVSDQPTRTAEIVRQAIAEPDGVLRQMQHDIAG